MAYIKSVTEKYNNGDNIATKKPANELVVFAEVLLLLAFAFLVIKKARPSKKMEVTEYDGFNSGYS